MKLTTSRLTGIFYLALAITGSLAFLLVRDQVYVAGDAAASSANLVDKESLARIGIALEVGLVLFQALVAVWFFKLFRKVNNFAAVSIAAFGLVNATALLVASAMWLGALQSALGGGSSESTFLLFNAHENLWLVGNLFFGLWLIPMAFAAYAAKMPRLLAWSLGLGGLGYVIATFVSILWPGQVTLINILPILATVGEFWIIGYLLFKKVKF